MSTNRLLPIRLLGKMVKRHGKFKQYIGTILPCLCADSRGCYHARPQPVTMIRINLLKPGIMVYNDSEPGGIIDIKHETKSSRKPDLVEILWDKKDFDKKMEEKYGKAKKMMNLPFDKIHDSLFSWGRLIIPWFGRDIWGERRWLAWFFIKGTFHKKGIKRTDKYGFHNCRIYGNLAVSDK